MKTALIVEDSVTDRNLLTMYLKKAGMTVKTAQVYVEPSTFSTISSGVKTSAVATETINDENTRK